MKSEHSRCSASMPAGRRPDSSTRRSQSSTGTFCSRSGPEEWPAAHRGQIEWDSVKRESIALIAARGASTHSPPIATRSHQAQVEIKSPTSYVARMCLITSPVSVEPSSRPLGRQLTCRPGPAARAKSEDHARRDSQQPADRRDHAAGDRLHFAELVWLLQERRDAAAGQLLTQVLGALHADAARPGADEARPEPNRYDW